MDDILVKYLTKFKKLRLDRSHGIAPHKPILLISILQAYQSGLISNQKIYLTADLVALFKSNWSALVTSAHDCRISYPFFYMKSEKFWSLKPKSGYLDIDKMGSLVKSFDRLNAVVAYAEIDHELAQLMMDKASNLTLLHFLLEEYFPESKTNYNPPSNTNLFDGLAHDFLNEPPGEYQLKTKQLIAEKADEEVFLRGNIFKRLIPKVYDNRCCISGMRIDTTYNISMIDACHIVPFSENYDDSVTNGIALCPNLHRAFDRGLIAITPDYEVNVSDQFLEDGDYLMKKYDGKRINLPTNQKYWPSQENLEWQLGNIFRE